MLIQRKAFLGLMAVLLLMTSLSGCLLAPQATPTPTPEPSPTPTPSPTPAPTVESMPLPELEQVYAISEGDAALAFGDYDQALQIFNEALKTATNDEQKQAALYGLGLTHQKRLELDLARRTLVELVNTYPDSIPGIRALVLLGQIYPRLERSDEALLSYETFLAKRLGVIDAYVYEQLGDLYMALEDYPKAIDAYSKAYLESNADSALAQKVAAAYEANGQPELALSLYQDIYYNSSSPYTKAQMNLLMARIYTARGESELAFERYQDSVNNYPDPYDSYIALATLVNEGQTVNELQRGIINYNIGQYDLAIEAFDRYLQTPEADLAAGLYNKALAVRAFGLQKASFDSDERAAANQADGLPEDLQAIAIWREITLNHSKSIYYVDAWEDIAYTQYAYMDDVEAAAQTALYFAAEEPESIQAASLLFTAGRYFEIAGKIKEAADTWARLGTEYPSAPETFQALFFGGMLYYRLEEFENALMGFNRALVLGLDPLETSGAYLWLGKTHAAMGNQEKAIDAWRAAELAAPNGYYGMRAAQLRAGEDDFRKPARVNYEIDWQAEHEDAKIWMRSTFLIPSGTDLNDQRNLALDPRYKSGLEFWALGMYEQGRNQFESLRNDLRTDPSQTFRLMQTLLDLGLYRSVIAASQSILALAGVDGSQPIPLYFEHLQYGPYYLDWVQDAANFYGLPVMLLLSVIHQESRFEGFAVSSAGARGLMQIMPETGGQIARDLAWPPNFTVDDLSIPYINLQLGANYLGRQLYLFEGDIYAALAAYNGGPGNAQTWKDNAGDDQDLFLGSVRFLETRSYIRTISEVYAKYLSLYGVTE